MTLVFPTNKAAARQWVRAVDRGLGSIVPAVASKPVAVVAASAVALSPMLPWTFSSQFPGDLTVSGNPAGLQIVTLAIGVLSVVYAVAALGVKGFRVLAPAGASRAVKRMSLGALGVTGYTGFAISSELGGLANWKPGMWIAIGASLLLVLAAWAIPVDTRQAAAPRPTPAALEILVIAGSLLVAMLVITYGVDTLYKELFIGYLLAALFGAAGLLSAGLIGRVTALASKYRSVTAVAALFSALLFPFTQSTDQFTGIACNALIFAAVALGLNIVIGLAGLLDLGYVAFLGVGAYTAAIFSGSRYSVLRDHPLPFWAAALLGAAVACLFGIIIGAPTLRLRGDYLAIVTLGFGEIFRISMNNLDGSAGPRVTNGPNSIPAIPELNVFGFDLGQPHQILGTTIGKFGNYTVLLLLVVAFTVFVFARANDSRIGRAWVAIREDETAASAMGVNGFKFKLLAFAMGASLAGLAGAVQAHVATAVSPENYVFAGPVPPNSAFLVAAVVLGGMGTVLGPLLGALLLYIIPSKLDFLQDKQLLVFGLALIVMMRLRPEGMVPNRRRQLEFHEEEIAEAEAHEVATAGLAGEGAGA